MSITVLAIAPHGVVDMALHEARIAGNKAVKDFRVIQLVLTHQSLVPTPFIPSLCSLSVEMFENKG